MGTFMSPSCEDGEHCCDGLCDEDQYTDFDGNAASCECKCHNEPSPESPTKDR